MKPTSRTLSWAFCYYFASRRYLYRPWNDIDAQTTTGSAKEKQRPQKSVSAGKLPGRIDTFLVQEGDWVRQGDTLVVINSPKYTPKVSTSQCIWSK